MIQILAPHRARVGVEGRAWKGGRADLSWTKLSFGRRWDVVDHHGANRGAWYYAQEGTGIKKGIMTESPCLIEKPRSRTGGVLIPDPAQCAEITPITVPRTHKGTEEACRDEPIWSLERALLRKIWGKRTGSGRDEYRDRPPRCLFYLSCQPIPLPDRAPDLPSNSVHLG